MADEDEKLTVDDVRQLMDAAERLHSEKGYYQLHTYSVVTGNAFHKLMLGKELGKRHYAIIARWSGEQGKEPSAEGFKDEAIFPRKLPPPDVYETFRKLGDKVDNTSHEEFNALMRQATAALARDKEIHELVAEIQEPLRKLLDMKDDFKSEHWKSVVGLVMPLIKSAPHNMRDSQTKVLQEILDRGGQFKGR